MKGKIKMMKYEYKAISVEQLSNAIEQMNEYGERGFRLKEIVKCGGNDAYFLIIMERETPMFKESLMKV